MIGSPASFGLFYGNADINLFRAVKNTKGLTSQSSKDKFFKIGCCPDVAFHFTFKSTTMNLEDL